MRLAIMQPYFLPYIGYWQLMNTVDTFVIYDNIEFSKNGWFHRNNILQNMKKVLFSIPIKKDKDTLNVIERCLADNATKQINKIISQIENNYKKAPYYKEIFPLIKNIFLYQESNLFRYILNSIKQINAYLEIDTELIISSEIPIDHSLKAQDKVIAINKNLHSSSYINPIGGKLLYCYKDFSQEGITLLYLNSDIAKYKQFNDEFVGYLSIIDILMFNSRENVIKILNQYHLVGTEAEDV